jgi:ABC-type Mn2+/Zn2+ transport system permease subunit
VFYRPFLALSFNEDKAKLLGMRPRLARAAMLGLVTLAVVIAFKTVGTLLVFGLLIAPPATASLVTRRVPTMMLVAVAMGALAVVGGLYVSYYAGTAAGATMATLSVVLFFVVLAVRGLVTE